MSWINLGEVFSVVRRMQGHEVAVSVMRDLRPQLDLDLPETTRASASHRIVRNRGAEQATRVVSRKLHRQWPERQQPRHIGSLDFLTAVKRCWRPGLRDR